MTPRSQNLSGRHARTLSCPDKGCETWLRVMEEHRSPPLAVQAGKQAQHDFLRAAESVAVDIVYDRARTISRDQNECAASYPHESPRVHLPNRSNQGSTGKQWPVAETKAVPQVPRAG